MCTVVEILEEIKKNITLEGSFILENNLQYTLNPPTKRNYTRRANLGIKKKSKTISIYKKCQCTNDATLVCSSGIVVTVDIELFFLFFLVVCLYFFSLNIYIN